MANRDLTTFRQVTNVVADESAGQIEMGIAKLGNAIIEQSEKAKMMEAQSRISLDIAAMQQEAQVKYQSNPMDGAKFMESERRKIYDNYSKNISPIYRRSFMDSLRNDETGYAVSAQSWSFKQAQQNTAASVQRTIENNLNQMVEMGRKYATDDTATFDAALVAGNGIKSIGGFAASSLGSETARGITEDLARKNVQAFMSGLAETNPDKALALMNTDEVRDIVGAQHMGELISTVQRAQAVNEVLEMGKFYNGNLGIIDHNNSDADMVTKVKTINSAEASGQITKDVAEASRNAVKSVKAVDAVTSNKAMSDIVSRSFQLGAEDISDKKYLSGIAKIQKEIIDKQASGEISAKDAVAINSRINAITNGRKTPDNPSVAFKESMSKFGLLPPQYRDEAVSSLFRVTDGKNLSRSQMNMKAVDIINDISARRREAAVKSLSEFSGSTESAIEDMFPDVDVSVKKFDESAFFKRLGITEDDVQETMKAKGMDRYTVIRLLRRNNGGQ